MECSEDFQNSYRRCKEWSGHSCPQYYGNMCVSGHSQGRDVTSGSNVCGDTVTSKCNRDSESVMVPSKNNISNLNRNSRQESKTENLSCSRYRQLSTNQGSGSCQATSDIAVSEFKSSNYGQMPL